jgi:hypothetical protein
VAARPAPNRVISKALLGVKFISRVPDLSHDRILPVYGIWFAEKYGDFLFTQALHFFGLPKSEAADNDYNRGKD